MSSQLIAKQEGKIQTYLDTLEPESLVLMYPLNEKKKNTRRTSWVIRTVKDVKISENKGIINRIHANHQENKNQILLRALSLMTESEQEGLLLCILYSSVVSTFIFVLDTITFNKKINKTLKRNPHPQPRQSSSTYFLSMLSNFFFGHLIRGPSPFRIVLEKV